MSDTQGADDTGSGGLTNDMPSIGNAPANVGRVPNPLASIARMIMGGAPAPQSAGPGRSPFQFPGQSQIPQQPGQPHPPQSNQRWTDTTASMYLPQGSNQPPANFTPFISSVPRDDFREWGTPRPYANLPQSFEAVPMAQGLGKFFGQNGGGLSPILALGGAKFALDYQKGVMMGQEYLAKRAKEKYQEYFMNLQIEEERRFREYHETMDEYSVVGGTTDMAKLGNLSIKGVSLHDAILKTARETNDDKVIAMLEDGQDMGKVMDFLKLRDKNLQDLQAHNQKMAEQDEDDSAWTGGKPLENESGTGGSMDPWANRPQAQPAAQGAPALNPAPGQQAPTMVASNAADPFQSGQQQQTEDVIGGTPEDNIVSAAMKTGSLPAELAKTNPKLYRDAMIRANRIGAELRNIANARIGGTDADKQAALDHIRHIAPDVATDVEGLLNYQDPLGGGQGGQGASPGSRSGQYSGLLRDLAINLTRNDPIPWNQNYYQEQRNFQQNNVVQGNIARMTTVGTTGALLDEALDALPANTDAGKSAWTRFFTNAQGRWSGDPNFSGVQSLWLRYNQEMTALIRQGGGSVTETMENAAAVPQALSSPQAYRRIVQQDAVTAIDRIKQMQLDRWTKIGGKGNFPGYDQEAYDELRRLANTEPNNRLTPGDTIDTDHGKLRWNGMYDKFDRKIPESQRWTPVQ